MLADFTAAADFRRPRRRSPPIFAALAADFPSCSSRRFEGPRLRLPPCWRRSRKKDLLAQVTKERLAGAGHERKRRQTARPEARSAQTTFPAAGCGRRRSSGPEFPRPGRRARPRAAILGRPAARALALDRFRESPKALRRSPARFRGRPVFARLFFRALSDFTRFPFSRVFRALPDFPISPSCLRGRYLSAAGRSVLAAPRSGSLFLPHLSSSRPRLPPSSVSPLSAHPPPHRRAIGSAVLRAGFDILRDLAVRFQNPTADQRFNSID